ncbi:hypothetical protein C0995_003388 [Termitomyces sp. Mi166|nr:hypothetical protein C0995_003388 [Termitomyces sp. Mi166\
MSVDLPWVIFFDAQALLEDSPVLSTTTVSPSASADHDRDSVSYTSDDDDDDDDVSTASTTIASDTSAPQSKLNAFQKPNRTTQLLRPHVAPYQTRTNAAPAHHNPNDDHDRIIQKAHSASQSSNVQSLSDSSCITLEDALLWRPLHVYPYTAPPPRFCMDTPFDAAAFSHARSLQRVEAHAEDPGARSHEYYPWRVDKDLPALPRKRGWRAGIRQTVSRLFRRHSSSKKRFHAITSASDRAVQIPSHASSVTSASRLIPASASPVCPRPRLSYPPNEPFVSASVAEQTRTACVCKRGVRRSRSFSGCPNVLADEQLETLSINVDYEPTASVGDEGMDEIAREGFAILREVARAWNVEPLPVVDDDGGDACGEMDQVARREALGMLGEVRKRWRFRPLNEDDWSGGW